NGLVYACTPIIIQKKHLANLFTGQVLFSPPDLEQFRSQAQKFGYDEVRYLESLSKVPVVDEKRLSSVLRYLAKEISFIAQKNLDILNVRFENIRHQDLLKQKEERLTLALEAATLGLWDWNIQTDELFFNNTYFNMLGYGSNAFPQSLETWKMLLHPDDLEKSVNAIQSSLSTTNPSWDIEFRMLSAKGGYRWIRGQGKVFEFTQGGAPLRATGTHQDITQQKNDEQDLQNKEQKYRELFNNMKSGVTIYTAIEDGNGFIIEERNAGAEKITGFMNRETLGRRVSEVFPGLEPLGVLDVFRRVYKTGISETIPLMQYQDKVLDLWLEIYVFKSSSGRIIAIYNDFTEQKLTEFNLKNRQVEFAQALDLAADAFCLGDANGIIIDVNQQTVVMSGYSRDELIGQHVSFLFSKAGLKKSPLDFSLLRTKGILMKEREAMHKNGTIIPIELHSQKMANGMFQSFIRDITARKHSQDTLLKSQRDLEMKKLQLEETNTALKVLIKNAEQEKLELEEAIAANILTLVEPHLDKLKRSGVDNRQASSIKIIESTLNNLVSPFVRTSIAMNLKLSPAEIQVANLIKQGKTSKQIAELLGLSSQTIDKHRSHIRKKIGVTNKDISLRELLTSKS
ncbi:MAG: PAS domain S-box protein, partial [Desulfuromusa sp.]|nr:PAS domain S-box protein [Desulfuromusa sp.]